MKATTYELRHDKRNSNAKKQWRLKVWFPTTRRTQLAVGSVSVAATFTLGLSVLDLGRQVIMCSITVRWVLRVLALTDGVHSLCTRHCPF